jgi:hypothetical protein
MKFYFSKLSHLICLILISYTLGFSAETTQKWYRGNTHTHTVICGHADSTPDFVAQWYHDRGYNFLVLSEHNHFIDPKTVNVKGKREDFILVPGIELTEKVHSTSLNVKEVIKPKRYKKNTSIQEMIQSHVDRAKEKGGECILNHPNFHWRVSHEDMLGVNNLPLFELYNGHPHVYSHGNHEHASTEEMWDFILSHGKVLYGVSSDDAHHFQEKNIKPKKSNPGRGWVMVEASSLTPDAITAALSKGKFYASNGVHLSACKANGSYQIAIDEKATLKELESPILRGKIVKKGKVGFKIEWISKDGKVLKTSNQLSDTFDQPFEIYLRPKVTYTRKLDDQFEEYYAWGQPKFK